MGNSQSLCQAEEQEQQHQQIEEESLMTVEELLPGESAAETATGSFVPDSATATNKNESKQDEANGSDDKEEEDDVVVVSARDAEAKIEEQEEQEAEEEAEEEKKTIILQTAPIDPPFPGANAARHCYVAYNEYHKCAKERGEDDTQCKMKARVYRSICPQEWTAHWNELREEGKWFGKY